MLHFNAHFKDIQALTIKHTEPIVHMTCAPRATLVQLAGFKRLASRCTNAAAPAINRGGPRERSKRANPQIQNFLMVFISSFHTSQVTAPRKAVLPLGFIPRLPEMTWEVCTHGVVATDVLPSRGWRGGFMAQSPSIRHLPSYTQHCEYE